MTFSESQKKGFFTAVESLKKYRRADLRDEKGKSILEDLYVDLLPDNFVLEKALLNNTTFLIGRKGTGKSTIFIRIEQILRQKKGYLSCYIDVKTIYEQSQTQYSSIEKIGEIIPTDLVQKYLIERTFIQNTLNQLMNELDKKYSSLPEKFAKLLIETKPVEVQRLLDNLQQKISDNKTLTSIEIPLLKSVALKHLETNESFKERENKLAGLEVTAGVKTDGVEVGVKTDSGITWKKGDKSSITMEKELSSVLLQVFQITDIISEIKNILSILNIDHLFILLDDFSEIDDHAIIRFVDVILAPLNNWSEEFIKFKIAAYPSRIYFGKIDPSKVDTIYLDFYNLYSEFDRDKMESNAMDFSRRLLENRLVFFADSKLEDFFDTDKSSLEEYLSTFFKISMNVPRILGYILSYCYQSKIVYDKKITISDLQAASQKYFEEKIQLFFATTTYSLISIDEKVTTLQLKELLRLISDKLELTRKRIQTEDLSGSSYITTEPYASHFYFNSKYDQFLKSLELNFFISKYNEMSDRDGVKSSIFCLYYGLAKKLNIPWGKPSGAKYRKYFIQRPFDFNIIIKRFLSNSKRIHCINPNCQKDFGVDDIKFLEFTGYKCNECSNPVIMDPISDSIKEVITKIDENKLLPGPELLILHELRNTETPLFAREIAQEIDYSVQLISHRGRKLDKEYGYVKRFRDKKGGPFLYDLTNDGETYFD